MRLVKSRIDVVCGSAALILALVLAPVALAQGAPGDVKLSFGFSYAQQPRSSATSSSAEKVPTDLAVSPFTWLILDVASDTYDWKQTAGSSSVSGGGDTTFSGSVLFHTGVPASWEPSVTATYSAKTPTSDPAVVPKNRNVQSIPELNLQFTQLPIWKRLDMTLKAGPAIQNRDGGGTNVQTAFEVDNRIKLSRDLNPLKPNTSLLNVLTYFSQGTTSPRLASDSISLSRKLSASITLGAGFKIGLTAAASRFGAFATVAYTFNYLTR